MHVNGTALNLNLRLEHYSSLSFLIDSNFSRAFVMLALLSLLSEGAVGNPSSELVKMPSSSLVAGGAGQSSL